MDKLNGTGVALVTPFKKDGSVDFEGLKKLVDFNITGGVNYLVINGTTGESVTTTTEEKKEILTTIRKQANGRVPLVYGVGGNNTQSVLDTLKATDFHEICAILSVSPYYNKPTQAGIYQHYLAIAEASPVPVILYNVPGRTGSNITAETTLKLAHHDNIIGIKEASGNLEQCMHIVRHKPAGFMMISGDDMLTVPMISFGAVGVISVLANAFPEKFCNMVKLALAKDFEQASKLMFDFLDLNPLMYEESNPVGVKAALELYGICDSHVRLPLLPATAGLKNKIQALL
jgi:4-hydroxy-tetrahydrodipicolinate synthase